MVSWKKGKTYKQKVRYLGFDLEKVQKNRSQLFYSKLDYKKELSGFLGMARFCQIWTPGLAEKAKLLYDTLKKHTTEEK